MTDSGYAQFGFSLCDVSINVFMICCQILLMSNLAFSLYDVTISVLTMCCQISVNEQLFGFFITQCLITNTLSCVFHTRRLAIGQKVRAFVLILLASMF